MNATEYCAVSNSHTGSRPEITGAGGSSTIMLVVTVVEHPVVELVTTAVMVCIPPVVQAMSDVGILFGPIMVPPVTLHTAFSPAERLILNCEGISRHALVGA